MTPGRRQNSETLPTAFAARRAGASVLNMSRLSAGETRIAALLYPERSYWRPRTRGDCANVPRPCPYVGCRHHLYLDVAGNGSMRFTRPELEVWDLEESCSLDVADRVRAEELEGTYDRDAVGEIINRTGARVEQIQGPAIEWLRKAAAHLNEGACTW